MKGGPAPIQAGEASGPNRAGPGPERTCLGCRAKKNQAGLDRLALSAGPRGPRVVWDKDRRLGGRGAWLCRDSAACLALAVKKRAFGRAFKIETHLDLTALSADNSGNPEDGDRSEFKTAVIPEEG